MPNPLGWARLGAESVNEGFEEYWKDKQFKEQMAERAQQKEAIRRQQYNERPYTPEELSAFQTKGTIPADRPASQQLALMKDYQSANKGEVLITDEMYKNDKKLQESGWLPGQKMPSTVYNAMRKPASGSSQNLTPEQTENLNWGMEQKDASGKPLIAPGQMTSRGPKTAVMADELGKMRAGKIPKKSLIDADVALAGAKAGASGEASSIGRVKGGQAQVMGTAAGVVDDNMKRIGELIDQLPSSTIEAANTAWRKGLKKVAGNEKASELLAHIVEAQEQQAVVLANGHAATDVDKKGSMDLIGPGLSKGSYKGVFKAIKFNNENKMKRMRGGAEKEPGYQGGSGKETDGYKYAVAQDGHQIRWKPGMKDWEPTE